MTLLTGKGLPRKSNKEGFTFLELMLVAIIIGIIISISTPLFRNTFNNIQLDNLSSNLAGLIKYSRERAIVKRLKHRLVFDDSGKKYRLELERDPLNNPGEFSRLKNRWGKIHSIPAGISLEIKEGYINFYPDGSISETTLYLTNEQGKTYTLITERTIGRVRVFNYRKE